MKTRWRRFAIRDNHYVSRTGMKQRTPSCVLNTISYPLPALSNHLPAGRQSRTAVGFLVLHFSSRLPTRWRGFAIRDYHLCTSVRACPSDRRVFFSGASSRYNFYSLPVIKVTRTDEGKNVSRTG